MKMRITCILLTLSLASVASAALFDDSVAPQSYHVLNGKNAAQLHQQANLTANNNSGLAPSNTLVNSESSNTLSNATSTHPQSTAPNSAPSYPTANNAIPSSSTARATGAAAAVLVSPLQTEQNKLKSALSQTVQQELLFETKTQAQILQLQRQNQLLVNTVQQLYKNVDQLKQQTSAYSTAIAKWPVNWFIELFGGVILVLLLLGMLLIYTFGRRKQADKLNNDNQGDYDFVGEEVVGSKIDLVHAYIAMGNWPDAQKILAELKNDGDVTQQLEVEHLLATVNAKLGGAA